MRSARAFLPILAPFFLPSQVRVTAGQAARIGFMSAPARLQARNVLRDSSLAVSSRDISGLQQPPVLRAREYPRVNGKRGARPTGRRLRTRERLSSAWPIGLGVGIHGGSPSRAHARRTDDMFSTEDRSHWVTHCGTILSLLDAVSGAWRERIPKQIRQIVTRAFHSCATRAVQQLIQMTAGLFDAHSLSVAAR